MAAVNERQTNNEYINEQTHVNLMNGASSSSRQPVKCIVFIFNEHPYSHDMP